MTQATAIQLHDLGKMYTLFRRPADKVFHALGLDRWMFWHRSVYQEFWALRGINLEVKAGERVGIIGQNGAGKSTLLKLITGGVTATEGTIRVKGRIQALLELGTGFHPEFSGRQNLRASLALQGLTPRQISQKENEIIDFAELEAREHVLGAGPVVVELERHDQSTHAVGWRGAPVQLLREDLPDRIAGHVAARSRGSPETTATRHAHR